MAEPLQHGPLEQIPSSKGKAWPSRAEPSREQGCGEYRPDTPRPSCVCVCACLEGWSRRAGGARAFQTVTLLTCPFFGLRLPPPSHRRTQTHASSAHSHIKYIQRKALHSQCRIGLFRTGVTWGGCADGYAIDFLYGLRARQGTEGGGLHGVTGDGGGWRGVAGGGWAQRLAAFSRRCGAGRLGVGNKVFGGVPCALRASAPQPFARLYFCIPTANCAASCTSVRKGR